MNSGFRRQTLFAALIAAAILPALRPWHDSDPRADAWSVPVSITTTSADLVTRTNAAGVSAPDGAMSGAMSAERSRAARGSQGSADDDPVHLVEVAIPRGFHAAGITPAGAAEVLGEGTIGGERIATVAIHAATRDPRTGELRITPRSDFEVLLRPEAAGGSPLARLREGRGARKVDGEIVRSTSPRSSTLRSVSAMNARDLGVDGGESGDFQVLSPSAYPSLEGSLVEYLILTSDDLKDEFQALADWYTEQGIPAAVRTVAQVEAAYPWGVDLQERIRLFIRDAYTRWGTAYVLLGGDAGVVPVRLVYNSYGRGEFLASDLYYSALDGTWDGDGDGLFGERYDPSIGAPGDSIDLYSEVHVGRLSVETGAEVTTIVNKLLTYTRNPQVGYQKKALFAGQVLFCYDPCQYPGDIILNGAWACDSAARFVPSDWDTVKLYEWPNQNENKAAIVAAMNQGYNLVAFANHGDPFKMSTGDGDYMLIADVDALTNNRKFCNLFYMNCNTSEIEAECINEHMVANPTGGAVSVIAPTRFDYPDAGELFIEEFYRLLFQRGVTEIGALQGLMKVPYAASAYFDPRILWNYESYILLGDPAMPVWQVNPDTLVATGSGTIALGDTTYSVTVTAHGSPVPGALVTAWNPASGEYGRAYTAASGVAAVPFRPRSTGSVRVTATHPAHLADLDSATVSGGVVRLHVESLALDDDMSGLSYGNGDGVIDGGERIELGVRLRNSTPISAPAGSCSLLVAPGSTLVVDETVDGVRRRKLLFVGEGAGHPPSIPATFTLGGGGAGMPPTLGRPVYLAAAQADTTGGGTGLVNGRAYLWEDAAGWHLRAAGAFANTVIAGTLTTNGSVRALAPWHIEPLDTARDLGGGVVRFRFALGASDEEDGLDLVIADSSHVSVLSGIAGRPAIPAGGLGTVNFLVSIAGSARDGERKRLDLNMGSAGREEVALDFAGPRPALYVVSVDDSTVSGDHDGIPEPGEIVRVWPRIRNQGGGRAVSVLATLRALSGGVATDSLALVGDIPSGQLHAAIDPFQMTVSALAPNVTVKLTDTYGSVWRDTLRLAPPPVPTGLVDGASPGPSPTTIDLSWNAVADDSLAGYLVYRAAAASGPYTLLTARLLPRVSYYQDAGVQNDSTYWYTVTAVDSSGAESRRSAALQATCRPPPRAGWPRTTLNAHWAGPTLADLDLDGRLEVIDGGFDGRVYVWNADGTLRAGWPRSTGGEIWDAPSVGNLDADSQLEIVVGSNDSKVYAWNPNGTGLIDTSGVFATTNSEVRGTPTVVDLDLDGTLEVLVGNSAGNLYAWKRNGTAYLGGNPVFASPSTGPIMMGPAVGNVDAGANPEIFFANLNGQVYAYKYNGTAFLGSGPTFYTAPSGDSSGFWGALAIGDLDRDGAQELVGTSWNGNVYAWRMTAALKPGFPRYIAGGTYIPYEDGTRYSVWSAPAIGDIDGDGKLDIVAGSRDQRVYAIKYDGTILPGWPYVSGFEVFGGPVLADIDDDGLPEVLVGSLDNSVHAVNGNGTRVPGWPVRTGDDVYASPAVGDLDGNTKAEVVVGSYDGFVHVWDTGHSWRVLSSPWPQYHHDIRHTGFYDTPLYTTGIASPGVEPAPVIPAAVMLSQNTPNPAVSTTAIRFGLPRETDLRLAVFDVEGRHVRELARGPWGAGWHEVRWDGRDRDGREVAPGVYFYRLEAGGPPLSRKFIVRR